MKRSALLLLLILAGCTPKFQPASNTSDTEMARAEWDCQNQLRAERATQQVTSVASQYPGVFPLAFPWNRRAFMINCMKAHGYEVAK